MARPLAADHEDKRRAFLKAAAGVFASQGYQRATMADIAAGAGVSKALIYHYYENKEQLLLAIIREHLEELVAAVAAADAPGLAPGPRLRALIGALLDCYRDADDEHRIQINELSKLPESAAAGLIDLERALVRRFSAALLAAVPELAESPHLVKPVTMNLFGMLNWKYMWFREDGPLSRAAYVALVADMVTGGAVAALAGARGAGADKADAGKAERDGPRRARARRI